MEIIFDEDNKDFVIFILINSFFLIGGLTSIISSIYAYMFYHNTFLYFFNLFKGFSLLIMLGVFDINVKFDKQNNLENEI